MGKAEQLPSRPESLRLEKKSVPLVANLLELMRNLGIPEVDIQIAFTDPGFKKTAESYLLSLALRCTGDQTAILGPLIGVSQSPEDTKEILTHIGNGLLEKLKELGLKDSVLAVLQGEETDDFNIFLTIDYLTGEAVRKIRQVAVDRGLAQPELNNMTLEAFDFWLHNRLTLNNLARKQNKEPWQLLGLELESIVGFQGKTIINDIYQQPIVPIINAAPLLAILPPEINRNINKEPPDIENPLGFLCRLNMAGHPIFRYLIKLTREHQERQSLTEKLSSRFP